MDTTIAPHPGFTWIPFYRELSLKLRVFADRQAELVAFLEALRAKGLAIMPLEDKDESGQPFLLREIDPFTFLSVFNRGLTHENRVRIAQEVRQFLEVGASVPRDFSGVPVVNNKRSWFVAYAPKRRPDDVPTLWRLFKLALEADPLANPLFPLAFDEALDVRGVNVNLTMGLFWIRPDVFLSLDGVMRNFADLKLPPGGLRFHSYLDILQDMRRRFTNSFQDLSYQAWVAAQPGVPDDDRTQPKNQPVDMSLDYWLVGAYWDDREPADQTDAFVKDGIWQNGYTDKFLDQVRQMKVGDRIAIKATSTQKDGLPFDARGKTVSRNLIKAVGTITRNHGDGRTVDVEWEPLEDKPRAWFFYTARNTVWRLRKERDFAQRLIRFVFFREPQDYDYFVRIWWDAEAGLLPDPDAEDLVPSPLSVPDSGCPSEPYSLETAISEGVFLSREELTLALERLEAKRNVILEGPPGVGKTFVAEKLAYALMEEAAPGRITKVQFHPAYSYEDFVRGFRPTNEAGKFELQDGPFLRACQAAAAREDHRHVLVIDEINRANTSQVFGELLMLLEADKRGMKPGVTLLYPRTPDERFAVPRNLFVIGTMNRADRSLALVDYALRRRFAFIALTPRFGDPVFRKWLTDRRMPAAVVQRVIQRMNALNATIVDDRQLGQEYCIGHSFFCPRGDDFSALDEGWFSRIVTTEIIPLLEEYWYGFPEKLSAAVAALLTP